MFRRSVFLGAPKTLADLRANMFEGIGEESHPPPGSVVLRRATQKAQPRYRFLTTFKEGHMRSPIDYFNTLVNGRKPSAKEPQNLRMGMGFLPTMRKKARTFVSHPPLLLDVPPESRTTTILLPKSDPLLTLHAPVESDSLSESGGAGDDASSVDSFELRQLRAILRSLQEAEGQMSVDGTRTEFSDGFRDGGLISFRMQQSSPGNASGGTLPKFTPVDLHVDRRFDSPGAALARLRELGHYLPCVYFDDQMYFEDDVVEAFGKGFVSIKADQDTVNSNSLTHVRSINQLWNMGFNLVLEGVHKDQIRKLRTNHGECEALMVGQRIVFKYDKVTEVPHQTAGGGENSVTFLTVRHTEVADYDLMMLKHSCISGDFAHNQNEDSHKGQIRKLLSGCEDFPQRQKFPYDFEKLLHTRPGIDEPKISELFQDLKAQVEIQAREARVKYNSGVATSAGRNRTALGGSTSTKLIKEVQGLCSNIDLREAVLKSWSKDGTLRTHCTEAEFRQTSRERQLRWALAKKVGTACGTYTDTMENTLLEALSDSKAKAIAHYRTVAKKHTTPSHFTNLELPRDSKDMPDPLKGLPFYDNLLA